MKHKEEEMTIMETERVKSDRTAEKPKEAAVQDASKVETANAGDGHVGGMFSNENISRDTKAVPAGSPMSETLGVPRRNGDITITAEDKAAFVDSVVGNTRFTKEYSLFGGKIKLTVRSLTVDEVNAIAVWIAKAGTRDPAGMMAGRYRKYLAAAQVARYNGTDMPPLEEPLFERLESDGKTVTPPGWTERGTYWDVVGVGAFNAVMSCLSDFDERYSTLCREADNSNFWNPDTH